MQKLLTGILIILVTLSVSASNDNNHIGARSAGMANASVTLTDMWAIHHNQAGLADVENISAGIYYENRFLVPELGLKGGVFVLPTKSGVFGVNVSSFGYTMYSENKIGVAYARKLGERFSMGIQLDYLYTNIAENYGSKGMLAGEIGIRAKITDELTMAAHVYNPTRAKISDYDNERVPTIMRLGFDYQFSENVFVSVETEKDVDQKPIFKSGIEYHITAPLYLRAGVATNPFLTSFGFGLKLKQFNLDIASSYHTVLGYTPQIALSYNFK